MFPTTPTPTKKAYLPNFPFITHISLPDFVTINDPVFRSDYNDWTWHLPNNLNHPINDLYPGINPIRNLFAELIEKGQVIWDGQNYTIRDTNGFWHTCKRYNINLKFPPTPIFTAPTADPNNYKVIAEYYKLFSAYHQYMDNKKPYIPYFLPTPLRPLTTNFQFPLSAKPSIYTKRMHCVECSDTSSSEDPQAIQNQAIQPSNKRLKRDDDYPN